MAKKYGEFIYNNNEFFDFLKENNLKNNLCFPPKFPLIARLMDDGETYFVHFNAETLAKIIEKCKPDLICQP